MVGCSAIYEGIAQGVILITVSLFLKNLKVLIIESITIE